MFKRKWTYFENAISQTVWKRLYHGWVEFCLDYWWWLYPTYANSPTCLLNFALTYIRHGVEIIKGAWRARGCPDDGHVNQDGRLSRVPLFATVICYRPFYFNDFHACVKRSAASLGKRMRCFDVTCSSAMHCTC